MSLGPLMISLKGPSLDNDERDWLHSPAVGGVILFTRNFVDPDQLSALVAEIHALRSPALLVAVDHEGGRVQRFRAPFVELPALRMLGHRYDLEPRAALKVAVEFGWLMAAEMIAVGIDLSFAPVVDLDLGLSEVIGDRALHEDAEVVASLAGAFIDGMQAAGMVATAKHFPTHAGAHADSHMDLAFDRRDYDALYDDLLPYRRLIAGGLHSIMISHVAFPKLDELPASLSQWWIETELRREFGFTGAVISDDMNMAGAAAFGTPSECVRRALDAGCDMVLLCNCPEDVADVIDSLEGYSDPAAQLRLMRLRARPGPDLPTLRSSARWQHAVQLIEQLDAPPDLKLEG